MNYNSILERFQRRNNQHSPTEAAIVSPKPSFFFRKGAHSSNKPTESTAVTTKHKQSLQTLGGGSAVNVRSHMFTGSEVQYEPVSGEGVMLMHKDGSSLRLNVISGQIAMQSFEAPLPKMNILKEHKEQILSKLEERKEAILKKRKSRAESYLKNGGPFTMDTVPQTPMSEINVDHLLEQWEERHNPRQHKDSPKRFTISPAVKQDIKNTLAVNDNGKIYFKKKKKSRMIGGTGRNSMHGQAMITAVEETQ